MRLKTWAYAGILTAVLLSTSACNHDVVDDPWLKPKVVRVVRAPSAQLTQPQLVAYCVTDSNDANVRNWLMLDTESWPIDINASETLLFELVSSGVAMDVATLHATHGTEFEGATIVRSTRSVDEGEVPFPPAQ